MVMRTWVRILQMKVSIIFGNNNYTKMSLLLYIDIPNHSKNTYTINVHSFPDLFPSSSIPPPRKRSDRTKETLMFLSHTPSLVEPYHGVHLSPIPLCLSLNVPVGQGSQYDDDGSSTSHGTAYSPGKIKHTLYWSDPTRSIVVKWVKIFKTEQNNRNTTGQAN